MFIYQRVIPVYCYCSLMIDGVIVEISTYIYIYNYTTYYYGQTPCVAREIYRDVPGMLMMMMMTEDLQ